MLNSFEPILLEILQLQCQSIIKQKKRTHKQKKSLKPVSLRDFCAQIQNIYSELRFINIELILSSKNAKQAK